MKFKFICIALLLFVLYFIQSQEVRIKLATTTSTENSGLLDYLLPIFEKDTGIKVDVISVGTGKALKLGENGDVDVVLVHARSLEDKFVQDGFGVNRKDVMYNDFIVLGPKKDPAKIKKAKNITDAFTKIAKKKSIFISRGDKSGTHVKELELWEKSGIKPNSKWYKESGLGMEEAINMANNELGYVLSDRGTYLSVKSKIDLTVCYEGDKDLFNPYGIIAVNPANKDYIKYDEAMKLIEWITSENGQKLINDFKIEGEQLFFGNFKE
ncbi:MAG: substrate-binding domain-containing protein [Spirochaetes bacterium]|nr:substrate-binding domain-containing protein [Spirochaetota bacterium]